MMCSDLTRDRESAAEMTAPAAMASNNVYMYSRQLSNVLRMAVQPLVKFR